MIQVLFSQLHYLVCLEEILQQVYKSFLLFLDFQESQTDFKNPSIPNSTKEQKIETIDYFSSPRDITTSSKETEFSVKPSNKMNDEDDWKHQYFRPSIIEFKGGMLKKSSSCNEVYKGFVFKDVGNSKIKLNNLSTQKIMTTLNGWNTKTNFSSKGTTNDFYRTNNFELPLVSKVNNK